MRSTFSLSKRILAFIFAAPLSLSALPAPFVLHDGTPLRMRLSRTLSNQDSQAGEAGDFEVLDVTAAQPERGLGRGARLNVNIDSERLADSEKIGLRPVKESKGAVNWARRGPSSTRLSFLPAAPLFQMMHGKDIAVPKGTEITAYINGEITLDPVKFPRQIASTETGQ